MVTVKFAADKLCKEQLVILPTITVEKDGNAVEVLFIWIRSVLAISTERNGKKKLGR